MAPSFFIIDPSKRCEPSAYLFTRAVNFFLANGYVPAGDVEESDIVLVNSCCVTEDKIATSRQALDAARAGGGGKQIVLLGCLAELPPDGPEPENLIRIGPHCLDRLQDHFAYRIPLDRIETHQLPPVFYEPGQGLGYRDYFVMIAQGCANGCSYCNIRRAKGDVRSRHPETIRAEIRQGLSAGVKEFALLADDCASYGRDLGTDLAALLEDIFAVADGFRVKLGYLFPRFVLTHFDRLKGLFGTGRISYVNIPVQSGSQRILDLMNRRYTAEAVREKVLQLRDAAPETRFCTHLMINFPTETEADFQASLVLADAFETAIFLNYSDNRGTAAADIYPKVSDEERRKRLDRASDYVNRRGPGGGAVISDFNCDLPYNVTRETGG
ncbi:MAG: radical SAM protein [Thermodesulfobacteriota bacterium]